MMWPKKKVNTSERARTLLKNRQNAAEKHQSPAENTRTARKCGKVKNCASFELSHFFFLSDCDCFAYSWECLVHCVSLMCWTFLRFAFCFVCVDCLCLFVFFFESFILAFFCGSIIFGTVSLDLFFVRVIDVLERVVCFLCCVSFLCWAAMTSFAFHGSLFDLFYFHVVNLSHRHMLLA